MAYTHLGASPPPPQPRTDRFGKPITASVPPPQVTPIALRPLLPGEARGDHRAAAIAGRALDPEVAAAASAAAAAMTPTRWPLIAGVGAAALLGVILLVRRRGRR